MRRHLFFVGFHFRPLRLGLLLLSALFVLLGWRLSLAAPLADFNGQVIESIEIEGARQQHLTELYEIIPLKIHDRYDSATIIQSIKLLYTRGLYAQVEVWAEPGADGVRLLFRLTPKKWIRGIRFQGNHLFSQSELRRLSRILAGSEFDPAELLREQRYIQEEYRQRGYYQTRVSSKSVAISESEQEIIFQIREGLPVRIARLDLTGSLGLSRADIESLISTTVGDILDLDALQRDMERIDNLYQKNDYYHAHLQIGRVTFDPAQANQAAIEIVIESGQKTIINFSGCEVYQPRKLLKLLDLSKKPSLSRWALQGLAKKIDRYYQDRGYTLANVLVRSEPSRNEPNCQVITFDIFEGPLCRVRKIVISGNTRLSNSQLRKQIISREASLNRLGGIFHAETFNDDLDAIRFYYHKNGYDQVRVDGRKEVDAEQGRVTLFITVNEGPIFRIGRLAFQGQHFRTREDLEQTALLVCGTPFSPIVVEEARTRILKDYFSNGLALAVVEAQIAPQPVQPGADPIVDVTFMISEGPRIMIGDYFISGNHTVSDKLIRRELDLILKTRTPAVYYQELILEAKKKLFQTGLFEQVKIVPAAIQRSRNIQDLVVEVREKDAGTMTWGFGISSEEGFGNIFEIGHQNYWNGRSLFFKNDVRIDPSDLHVDHRRSDLVLRNPWFFDHPVDVKLNMRTLVSRERNFEYERFGFYATSSLDLAKYIQFLRNQEIENFFFRLFLSDLKLVFGFKFEEDDILNIYSHNLQGRPVTGLGEINIGTVFQTMIKDKRDSILNPTRGYVASATAALSHPWLLAETKFYQLLGGLSLYQSILPEDFHSVALQQIVWANALDCGLGHTIGSGQFLPISKRFFLGGRNSLRGFANESIGSNLSNDQQEYYYNFHSELRFDLAYSLGFVSFLEGGSVMNAPDTWELTRLASGLGLRYNTPIGPLSLDFGFPIRRLENDVEQIMSFTIGNAF